MHHGRHSGRGRSSVIATVFVLLCLAGLVAIRPWPRAAALQGKSLHYWLEQLWTTNRPQAEVVIQKLGTNIVPSLRAKLEREHSPLRTWSRANWPALPHFVQRRLTAPAATEDTQEPVYRALRALGPEVVPSILPWLEASNVDILSVAIRVIEELGPAAGGAVPSLAKMLEHPDGGRRTRAVYALASIGTSSNGAVGPLAQVVRGSGIFADELRGAAALALGRLGPGARGAVPALQQLLTCTNSYARLQAEVALRSIEGD